MTNVKRLGFYKKSNASDKKLVSLFNRVQKIRYEGTEQDWQSPKYFKGLLSLEYKTKKHIEKLFRDSKLKTKDDFYRAAFIYHHGNSPQSYALAVALAAVSYHLGESWGKNLYAVAVDRLLNSLGLPQHFGTQFEKKKDKWELLPTNPNTTDAERKRYNVEPLDDIRKRITLMNSKPQ